MAPIWNILLPCALGLLTADAVAQHKTHDDLTLAATYLKAGKFAAAEAKVRKALAGGDHNPEAHRLLGLIYDETGRTEKATQEFLQALQLDPTSQRIRNSLGAHYFRREKLDLAAEQFRQVLASGSNEVTANHYLGLIHLQQGQPATALPFLKTAQSQSPRDRDILFNLARCYFALARNQDAVHSLDEVLANTAPDDGATFYAVGMLLVQNGQFRPAISALERARKLSPANSAALVLLADAHRQAGQFEESWRLVNESIGLLKLQSGTGNRHSEFLPKARQVVEALNAREPGSYQKGSALAEILYVEKKYAESRSVLGKLEAQGKQDPDFFNLLGMVYGGLNQLPEAAQAVIEAIRLAPNRSDLIFNLAGLYQKAGDNASAVKVLQQALAQGKVSPEIHFALGLSYFNVGNFSLAVDSFQRSVKLQPNFYRAHFDLGRALGKLSRFDEAMKAYKQALVVKPDFYAAHYEMALLLSGQQQTAAAVRHFKETVRLQPGHSDAHYQLGKIYLQQNQRSEAAAEFEKAIQGNPDHDAAYNGLARIHLLQGEKAKAEQLMTTLNDRKQNRKAAFQERISGSH
jgi:Flp pilus assembly protein TadD